ncbi:TPA: Ig-like domain-containing protein [Listeria innocua]|uniref:Ig-like domain-containing protein n=1 Tax=Listeria innocua TaxID=1642 RepID=UPI00226F5F3A|nr:Ig-like domain-containing protein [Listeria innocua]
MAGLTIEMASYLGDKVLVRIIDTQTNKVLSIGGQKSATWGDTADTIEVTTKTGGITNYRQIMTAAGVKPEELPNKPYNNFKEYIQGQNDWKVDTDGSIPSSDDAYNSLEKAKNEGSPVLVSVLDLGRNIEKIGIAIIVDMSEEAPLADVATYTLSLQGSGEYVTRPYTPPVAPTAISVAAISVKVGETVTPTITTTPTDASQVFTYSILDETKATVNQVTGEVTGVLAGTTKYTVKSLLDPEVSKEVTVTITTA